MRCAYPPYIHQFSLVAAVGETGRADEHGGGRVRIAYLWQDAVDQLRIDPAGLRRIRPDLEKFNYPLAHRLAMDKPVVCA